MALRRRIEGELTIEQTRELGRVAEMLSHAGMCTHGLEWPSACYLIGWFGREPVGVVGFESRVASALLRSLIVVEPMRGRGFGAKLVAAARKAAVAHGIQRLYTLVHIGHDYFERFGFEPIAMDEAVAELAGLPLIEHVRKPPDKLGGLAAFFLDISRDGIIER